MHVFINSIPASKTVSINRLLESNKMEYSEVYEMFQEMSTISQRIERFENQLEILIKGQYSILETIKRAMKKNKRHTVRKTQENKLIEHRDKPLSPSDVSKLVHLPEALQRNICMFTQNILFTSSNIQDDLVSMQCLSEDECTDITSKANPKDQVRLLIRKIKSRGPESIDKFLKVVEKDKPELIEEVYKTLDDIVDEYKDKPVCAICIMQNTVDLKDIVDSLWAEKIISDDLFGDISACNSLHHSRSHIWSSIIAALNDLPEHGKAKAILINALQPKYIVGYINQNPERSSLSCWCCKKCLRLPSKCYLSESVSQSDISLSSYTLPTFLDEDGIFSQGLERNDVLSYENLDKFCCIKSSDEVNTTNISCNTETMAQNINYHGQSIPKIDVNEELKMSKMTEPDENNLDLKQKPSKRSNLYLEINNHKQTNSNTCTESVSTHQNVFHSDMKNYENKVNLNDESKQINIQPSQKDLGTENLSENKNKKIDNCESNDFVDECGPDKSLIKFSVDKEELEKSHVTKDQNINIAITEEIDDENNQNRDKSFARDTADKEQNIFDNVSTVNNDKRYHDTPDYYRDRYIVKRKGQCYETCMTEKDANKKYHDITDNNISVDIVDVVNQNVASYIADKSNDIGDGEFTKDIASSVDEVNDFNEHKVISACKDNGSDVGNVVCVLKDIVDEGNGKSEASDISIQIEQDIEGDLAKDVANRTNTYKNFGNSIPTETEYRVNRGIDEASVYFDKTDLGTGSAQNIAKMADKIVEDRKSKDIDNGDLSNECSKTRNNMVVREKDSASFNQIERSNHEILDTNSIPMVHQTGKLESTDYTSITKANSLHKDTSSSYVFDLTTTEQSIASKHDVLFCADHQQSVMKPKDELQVKELKEENLGECEDYLISHVNEYPTKSVTISKEDVAEEHISHVNEYPTKSVTISKEDVAEEHNSDVNEYPTKSVTISKEDVAEEACSQEWPPSSEQVKKDKNKRKREKRKQRKRESKCKT